MVNFKSLSLQHHTLVLVLSSITSPSPRQQHLYLRRQILCLQSMVVYASVQSRSKNPNSNLPLLGKQVADSSITLVLERQLETSTLVLVLSLFAILVSESNQPYSIHSCWRRFYLLVCLLYRVRNFVPAKKKALFGFSGLLRIFASLQHTSQSRLPTCCSEDRPRSSFFPSTLVLEHSSFAILVSESKQNPSPHSFQKDLKNLVDLVVQQKQLVQTRRRLYSLHGYGSGRYSSAHLLRAEVCPGKIPPRRGIHYLPTQSYRDWSATCRSSWRTGRVLYSCSRSWYWKTLWIQWCSRSSSLQSNRQDYSLLFEGNAAESETNSMVAFGSLFGFASATEATAVAEEKQALFSFAGNLQERTAPAPHVTTGGLFGFSSTTEAKVFDYPKRTTLYKFHGTAEESASIAEEGTATPGLDVNGNLVERAAFAHAGTGSIFGFSSTTEAKSSFLADSKHLHRCWQRRRERDQCRDWFWYTFWICWWRESTSNAEVKSLSSPSVETQLVEMSSLLRNLAVGQVRIGLSNDGIPGDGSRGITIFRLRTFQKVRRSDLLEQKQSPLPQHLLSVKVNSILRRELRILSLDILNIETHNLLEL